MEPSKGGPVREWVAGACEKMMAGENKERGALARSVAS